MEGPVLVRPAREHLAEYRIALMRGWSPDTHDPSSARRTLEQVDADPDTFLERFEDPGGNGPPVRLPDGSFVKRLPGIGRWIWDGEFCGSIGLRWSAGTAALPRYCLGHIGYTVVPWKQRRGYATRALGEMLAIARERGLPYVELVTDIDNTASQKVIAANGGVLTETFERPPETGAGRAYRFRIELT